MSSLGKHWKLSPETIKRISEIKKTGVEIKCLNCKKLFYIEKGRIGLAKFCSKKCFIIYGSKGMFKKGHKSFQGKAEKNSNWHGDNVGYGCLHKWIKRRLAKPKICPLCKKRAVYDLTNKGIYNRDLKNWEWLCRSCHMRLDGRTEKLILNSHLANTGKKRPEHSKLMKKYYIQGRVFRNKNKQFKSEVYY